MRNNPILFLPFVIALIGAIAVLAPASSVGTEAQPTFDHFTTGFDLVGAHRLVECESCHIDAVFTGTPRECSGCHTQGSTVRATWQPPMHMLVTENCDGCHRSFAWVPVARVDHVEVQGTCSTCHNNFTAGGQHPQHIPTVNECDACHNTRFWR